MTHFVYPYIEHQHPVFGWELMYSIRSLYVNFEGNFDITIIGEIPDWIDSSANNLRCVEFDNTHWGKRVQSRTNQKLLLAADMFTDLVLMHDDFYLVNKCTLDDFKEVKHISTTLSYNREHEQGLNTFKKQIRHTYFQLKDLGKRYNVNYANHAPFYFQSERLKEIDQKFNITSIGDYTTIIENAYYNYFEVDSKPIGNYRIGYWGESNQKITKETKILNHDERGFWYNPWIVSYLNGLFPKKSPIEK